MKNQEMHLPTPNPEHPYGGGNGHYRFPDINGMNLLGDNISLPPIVPKSFHIMLTVFHPEALYGMKTWLPFCENLRKQYKHTPAPVEYGILLILQPPPIEGDVPSFTQALGDFPDFYMKIHSLISYHDQSFVRSRLSLHKKAETAIVLLDGNGNIIWKDDGDFTASRAEHLEIILETLSPLVPGTRTH